MLFALILLVILCVLGLRWGELHWGHIGWILCVLAGGVWVIEMFRWPPVWFTAVPAVLDIFLVLRIFKGDIRVR